VVAQRRQALLAVPAAAARDERAHDHAVTGAVARDGRAHLADLAHELVAQHVACLHERDVAAEQVQDGALRYRQPHLHDHVLVVEQARVLDPPGLDLVHAGPAQGLHDTPTSLAWSSAARSGALRAVARDVSGTSARITSPVSNSALVSRS